MASHHERTEQLAAAFHQTMYALKLPLDDPSEPTHRGRAAIQLAHVVMDLAYPDWEEPGAADRHPSSRPVEQVLAAERIR